MKTEVGMQGGERFRDVGMRRAVVRRVVGVLQCRVGVGGESDQAVRTVERHGREVARGRRAVDPAALGGDTEGRALPTDC